VAEDRDDAQRTEEPTQRRLDDARASGDVVKSAELSSFILMSGATLAVVLFAGSAAKSFALHFTMFLEHPQELTMSGAGVMEVFHRSLMGLLDMLAPPIGLLMAFGLGGHLIQNRPSFSPDKLMPDFSKLSLIAGFHRLFGLEGIVNLLKGLVKIVVMGTVAYSVLKPEIGRIGSSLDMTAAGTASLAMTLIAKLLLAALIVMAILAAADYVYQRQRWMARHRMTRQEMKDEFKQSEGDPLIRAKIRQIRAERAKTRMMAAVPKATVIITNPTHYAVALSYESGKMAAPVCVAKGADDVALRIREIAQEHDVPIVENPPLARALYATVEIDDAIPAEHYKAVAHVIGYVLRLAAQRKFWKN
jgi:flagellar biosynthetic protein FlhB